MQDNDFWIGQEQIPVDLSLLLTYSNDEDYWYAPGEYALRVYTVDTLNTNFARPCFAFGERTSNPEMEDVSGAIENTLHELLDSGATPEDVYRIMGLVKESELSPETKEADSYLPIDLGYCIDGNIVSYEAVPESVATVPENVDYPRYAEAMESHVPLPIATQIAKHDFSHRQADILMEAARNPHVSPETLETIADKTLSSGKMRGLLDIASVGKNPLDFHNMDEQTLKAAVSVLFHGGKDLPVTELDLAQLRSVDLALMDGASPAEAMRAAEKSASAEPEVPAASLASEADAMRLTEHEYNGFQANAIIAAALNPAVGEDVLDALATPKYTAAQMTAIAKIAIRGGDFARFLDPQMDARRMEAAYLVVAHGGSDLPVEHLSRSQLLTINNILLRGHIPYETVRAIAKPAFTPESMEVIAAAMENARHDPYTGEHSLTEAQVARIMNPEYRPEQQIALLTAMRGQTPVADLSDADFAGLFPASLSVEQMSACAYAVNRCGYNSPLLMMTMQACADMNAQQLMAVFDATAAEFSDATMAKVSTILMHTPALTSQQMRYLLAEARDGTPFPALESMKEHLLAQVEPEKAQVTETGIKSESRDMASGKEALAEQAGLDGTQKINQNKEME